MRGLKPTQRRMRILVTKYGYLEGQVNADLLTFRRCSICGLAEIVCTFVTCAQITLSLSLPLPLGRRRGQLEHARASNRTCVVVQTTKRGEASEVAVGWTGVQAGLDRLSRAIVIWEMGGSNPVEPPFVTTCELVKVNPCSY